MKKSLLFLFVFFFSLGFARSALSSQVNLQPAHILSGGAMTGTSALTSAVIDVRYLAQVGFQCYWTGTAQGTFSIQSSKNYIIGNPGAEHWTDIGASVPNATGTSGGDRLANIQNGSYGFLKLVYTNSASTGTLDCWADGKGY